MKYIKLKIFSLFFILFIFNITVFAKEYKQYATYSVNNLTLTSYSKSWNRAMLKNLYDELLNNFHSDELQYLKNIYIYPDSPEGVNALYYDDIYIENNKYKLGNNAYINLYNGERYNTIPKIAYTLSHEYGHHYMIYNLVKNENIYYHNLKNSKYVDIRKLKDTPVTYEHHNDNYIYYWDITEIMADDYVQLLGSNNARKSYDYKSVDELLNLNQKLYKNPSSFNLSPQLNPFIPLAADIQGLYSYLLNIGGFTAPSPKPLEKPKLNNITGYIGDNNEFTYNITWDNPNKNQTLEYTLVIYPENNPFVAYPLKTLLSKEPLNVTFGSYSIKQKDGKVKSISQKYDGNYTLRLYIRDSLGFIYSSEPLIANFTQINKNILFGKDSPKRNEEKTNINDKPSSSPDDKTIKQNNKLKANIL